MLGIHQSFGNPMSSIPVECANIGADTFQVFIRNNRNMNRRNISKQEVDNFNYALLQCDINSYVVHAPYALNLCESDPAKRARYVAKVKEDFFLLRYMAGVKYYVIHPGSSKDLNIIDALDNVVAFVKEVAPDAGNTKISLEWMAGAGTQVLCDYTQISYCMSKLCDLDNVGICFDTCHVYASGADVFKSYKDLGKHVNVVHLNNSKAGFGTHVDRHENLQKGLMYFDGLVNFATQVKKDAPQIPIILETPGELLVEDFNILRSLGL